MGMTLIAEILQLHEECVKHGTEYRNEMYSICRIYEQQYLPVANCMSHIVYNIPHRL